jgi:hypothetical protein
MKELGLDARSIDLIVGADGWGRPDPTQLSTLANVAPCPDPFTDRDIDGVPALLEMTVTDQKGLSVMVTQTVVPTCTAADATSLAVCQCECRRAPVDMGPRCAASDLGM